jgi:hypothetical protein
MSSVHRSRQPSTIRKVESSASPRPGEGVDALLHAKYDRYCPSIVGTVVSPDAARSTLRLRRIDHD